MENEIMNTMMEEVVEEAIIPTTQAIVEETIVPEVAKEIVQDVVPEAIEAMPAPKGKHSWLKTVLFIGGLGTLVAIKPVKKAINKHQEKKKLEMQEMIDKAVDERMKAYFAAADSTTAEEPVQEKPQTEENVQETKEDSKEETKKKK